MNPLAASHAQIKWTTMQAIRDRVGWQATGAGDWVYRPIGSVFDSIDVEVDSEVAAVVRNTSKGQAS